MYNLRKKLSAVATLTALLNIGCTTVTDTVENTAHPAQIMTINLSEYQQKMSGAESQTIQVFMDEKDEYISKRPEDISVIPQDKNLL